MRVELDAAMGFYPTATELNDKQASGQDDGGYHNLGSMEGSLKAITLHPVPSITIWDRVYGMPVPCFIPDESEWIDNVKGLLGQKVLVSGDIYCLLQWVAAFHQGRYGSPGHNSRPQPSQSRVRLHPRPSGS